MERKWKALILVDGYNGGVAHITADQIRDHNIAMYGDGDYVLPVGDKFAYEIVNNNTINLSSGMVVMNGARAVTGYGKTEVLTIENGTSGYKRADIIVAEYSKDNETLVESVTVKVVKGTLGSAYSDPALVTGDIRAGATKRQMALYRVKVNGLSIEAVEKMWTAAAATLGANIVPIAQGGTGATTAMAALEKLGLDSIGKFYEQHFDATAIPVNTSKALASLTLPAGTYVVEGSSSWNVDNRNMYIMAFIRDVTANREIAMNRGVMIAGGGIMPTAVVKFDVESTITMYAYWGGGSGTARHNSDYLRAVKVK